MDHLGETELTEVYVLIQAMKKIWTRTYGGNTTGKYFCNHWHPRLLYFKWQCGHRTTTTVKCWM